MSKKFLTASFLCAGAFALNAQAAQPVPVLDAFQKCDWKTIPKTVPVKLSGGLVIKSIKNDPATPDQKVRIVLKFNMRANGSNENQEMLVKRLTGYDFSKSDNSGAVFEQSEDGPGDYLACTRPGQ